MISVKAVSAAAALLVAAAAFAQPAQPRPVDWIDSPEAYFITTPERNEWLALKTAEDREQFKSRYWARRDPTPATERNEFREIVMNRIATADKQFPLENQKGSETARGEAFIVLGSPAKVTDSKNEMVQPGDGRAYSLSDSNEIFYTWTYDKLRTPKILNALNRAALELRFRVEPSRRKDMLEDPGVFAAIRDQLSEMSLVSRPTGASRAELVFDRGPGPALSAEIEQQLDAAAAGGLSSATIWGDDEKASTMVWLNAPQPSSTRSLMLYGRVRNSDGKTVATIAREARPALGFTTAKSSDLVVGSQLELQPGAYDAALMITEAGSTKGLSAKSARIIVPQAGSDLRVSSLLLTDAVTPATSTAVVTLGGNGLRPRADATFAKGESLWYVFQVANPADAANIKLHVMVRSRDGQRVQAADLPGALQPTGPRSFVGGYELALSTLNEGDYSLYVTVADAGGREEVRRADFRVVGGAAQ